MGARSKNYYNDLARRLGYEAAAVEIQDHFLAGRRKEAEAAVPDALIDETSLSGRRSGSGTVSKPGRRSPRITRSALCCWSARRRKRCGSSPKPSSDRGLRIIPMTELLAPLADTIARDGFAFVRAPEMGRL